MTREGDQKPKFTEMLRYKDLSVNELQEFLSLTSSMADAERFLSGVLGLDDYTIKPQNAFVLDYCIGILLFGQEAGLGLQQISNIYALGIEILDILSKGGTFEETEVAFQSKMLSLTSSESDQDCLSLLTPADLQKTTLHFISTVFQHHALYRFCFTKEHPIKTQSENVYVETAIVPPLWEALIAEEVEEQQDFQGLSQFYEEYGITSLNGVALSSWQKKQL